MQGTFKIYNCNPASFIVYITFVLINYLSWILLYNTFSILTTVLYCTAATILYWDLLTVHHPPYRHEQEGHQ